MAVAAMAAVERVEGMVEAETEGVATEAETAAERVAVKAAGERAEAVKVEVRAAGERAVEKVATVEESVS